MTDEERRRRLDLLRKKYGSMTVGPATHSETEQIDPTQINGVPVLTHEQQPDTGMARALIKNLSNSDPMTGVNYLRQKFPNLDVEPMRGNIAMRVKGSKDPYRVLDPENLDWQDITDVAGDLAQGVTTTAASALGGLAGGLPGAAVAGGATNAGLEALKQKLGSLLGLPQTVQGKDVAMAGGTGAAAPLLFGTGTTGAQIAEKAATQNLPEEMVAATQKGLPSRLYNALTRKALPAGVEYTTGIPREATKTLINNYPEVVANDASDLALAKEAQASVVTPIKGAVADAASQLREAYKTAQESGSMVPIQKAKDQLKSQIATLESQYAMRPTDIVKQNLEDSKKLFSDYFLNANGEEIGNELPPQGAFGLEQDLKTPAQTFKTADGLGQKYSASQPVSNKALSSAAERSRMAVTEELKNLPGVAPAKEKYADLMDLQDSLESKFATPESTGKTLRSLDTDANRLLKQRIQDAIDRGYVSPDLLQQKELLQARSLYQNPSMMPLSRGSVTSTSKSLSVPALGGAAGYALGGPMGAAAGVAAGSAATSPAAVRAGINTMLWMEQMGNKVPQSSWINMFNSMSPEDIQNLQEQMQ